MSSKKKKKKNKTCSLSICRYRGYGNAVLTALCVKTPTQGNDIDHKDGVILPINSKALSLEV